MAEKLPVFKFETAAGDTIEVRKFSALPGRAFRLVRRLDPADQMFTILEEYASEEAMELIDELPMDELNTFLKHWQSDSGVTVGKF
ncbi:MAG: hypothetical protein Q4D87_08995 [Actinomycetaceae bacterium]|nr:hypothetical protein [Actinomycetaceae bacterium]